MSNDRNAVRELEKETNDLREILVQLMEILVSDSNISEKTSDTLRELIYKVEIL